MIGVWKFKNIIQIWWITRVKAGVGQDCRMCHAFYFCKISWKRFEYVFWSV